MSLLLELHQSKLAEIDGPLTCKLHRCLYHSEVEVKSDLLDLATFLCLLWTDFVGRKRPGKVLAIIRDAVSPHSACVSFYGNTNSPKASAPQKKLGTCGERNHRVWGRVLCLLTPLYRPWTPRSGSGVQRAESSILPALCEHIGDGTRGRGEAQAEKGLDWQTDRQGSIDSQTTIINSTLLSSVWCVAQGQVENLSVAASSANRFPLIFQ